MGTITHAYRLLLLVLATMSGYLVFQGIGEIRDGRSIGWLIVLWNCGNLTAALMVGRSMGSES